jgi:hypothetical protein
MNSVTTSLAQLTAIQTALPVITEALTKSADNVLSLQKALPTHALGEFPVYMNNIVDLIRGAKSTLHVLCDFPAYGQFSNPDESQRYRHALAEQALKVRVQLICLNQAWRSNNHSAQFPADWTSMNADEKFKRKVADFNLKNKAKILDAQSFRDVILARHDQAITEWPFETYEVGAILAVHLWIADNTKAIFSFCSFGNDARLTEYAFETTDTGLIAAFQATWKRYRNLAEDSASTS